MNTTDTERATGRVTQSTLPETTPGTVVYEQYPEKSRGGIEVARKNRDDRAKVLRDCGYQVSAGSMEVMQDLLAREPEPDERS